MNTYAQISRRRLTDIRRALGTIAFFSEALVGVNREIFRESIEAAAAALDESGASGLGDIRSHLNDILLLADSLPDAGRELFQENIHVLTSALGVTGAKVLSFHARRPAEVESGMADKEG